MLLFKLAFLCLFQMQFVYLKIGLFNASKKGFAHWLIIINDCLKELADCSIDYANWSNELRIVSFS